MLIINETITVGDTFEMVAILTDSITNAAITGIAANLTAQIRSDSDTLICNMTVAETATPGTYTLTPPNTSNWFVDFGTVLKLQLQYTVNDVTTSSELVGIPVEEDRNHV